MSAITDSILEVSGEAVRYAAAKATEVAESLEDSLSPLSGGAEAAAAGVSGWESGSRMTALRERWVAKTAALTAGGQGLRQFGMTLTGLVDAIGVTDTVSAGAVEATVRRFQTELRSEYEPTAADPREVKRLSDGGNG